MLKLSHSKSYERESVYREERDILWYFLAGGCNLCLLGKLNFARCKSFELLKFDVLRIDESDSSYLIANFNKF